MIEKSAKPFLKWAGGKTQLLAEVGKNLPDLVVDEKFTYIEPFVGSGAVLFWLLSGYPQLEKAVVNDINEDLINTYKAVKSSPKELISILEGYKKPTICDKSNLKAVSEALQKVELLCGDFEQTVNYTSFFYDQLYKVRITG